MAHDDAEVNLMAYVGGYDDEGTATEADSGTPAALSERNGFELAVEDTNQRLVAIGLPALPSSYRASTSESQTGPPQSH